MSRRNQATSRSQPAPSGRSRGRTAALTLYAMSLLSATPLLASGCNETTVGAVRGPEADFTAYRSYSWAEPQPSGIPAIDDDLRLHQAIRREVDEQLARIELEPLAAGDPGPADLVITYHLAAERRLESTAIERYTYSSQGRKDRPAVIGQPFTQERRYVRGTLVLDMVDTTADRVVWRGWAHADVDDYPDDPDAVEARVRAVIARLLVRFPGVPEAQDNRP